MKPLFEQYRPSTWSDVIGQAKALRKLDVIRRRGLAGKVYWITGQSGIFLAHHFLVSKIANAGARFSSKCEIAPEALFVWFRKYRSAY